MSEKFQLCYNTDCYNTCFTAEVTGTWYCTSVGVTGSVFRLFSCTGRKETFISNLLQQNG